MQKTSPLVRSAIFVRDIEKSTRFYREILGLTEVWYEGDISEGNAHELLGMPPGSYTRARILKSDGPAWGMIGLFEITNPMPKPISADPSQINLGETCLVFYCTDLTAVTAMLERQGYAILCPPTMLRLHDLDRQREMTFRDPDGVLINLIEWDQEGDVRPEEK